MPTNVPVNNQTIMILSQDDKALREIYLNQWFANKKKEFYQNNGIRIESLHEKMRALQREYFVVENEQIVKEGEGKDALAKMLDGKSREEFDTKFKELMEKENTMKI